MTPTLPAAAFGFLLALTLATLSAQDAVTPPWFGIHVVDDRTGRGVPLMELRTLNDVRYVTDHAGWAAFHEPGMMNHELFFHLSGPGYSQDKDGFGFTGIRVTPKSGEITTIKVRRDIIAERIGRLTGQGIYRDSELLGLPTLVQNWNAGVMGQDSVQAVPYRGKIFWLWGDTNIASYPLGNFQTTSATTPPALKPEQGIVYEYFMDAAKPDQLRHMMPLPDPGAVWIFGLLNVKDDQDQEQLIAHYGRFQGLTAAIEHGIARFDDARGTFVKATPLDGNETWRHPTGSATQTSGPDGDWFYFAEPFTYTRVKATLKDVLNPASYEAFRFDPKITEWQWQKAQPHTTQAEETKLLLEKKMKPEQARYQLQDAGTGRLIRMHRASIKWNSWRKRWIMISTQSGDKEDPSALGEVWYAESNSPDGPWQKAIKIASHPGYTFYNPIYHDFLDADGGRIIYFEGTYTQTFSGNPLPTARYEYNQLMYRLDLSDSRLEAAHAIQQ